MGILKHVLLILILFATTGANTTDFTKNKRSINAALYIESKGYDFDLKSYKGWIRVLTSKDRRTEYKFNDISEERVSDMIMELLMADSHSRIDGKMK